MQPVEFRIRDDAFYSCYDFVPAASSEGAGGTSTLA